jgi:hypothetical protein
MTPENPSIRLFRQDAPPAATDLQTLLQHMTGLAEEGEPLRITVDYKGQRVELIAGKAPKASANPASVGPDAEGMDRRLAPLERSILRAVAGLDTLAPIAKEIAEKGKLPFESHLRKALAAMRSRGLLGGAKGETGYPLTAAGQAALDGTTKPAAGQLTEGESDVLQAVAELPESPKGAEIAARAGYPYDAHLKMRLSSLRKRHFLGGSKRETGYPLTKLGRMALAEAKGASRENRPGTLHEM